ncbi:hypothetical protein V6N12_042192 [Hibiscus sabdariffa]|uniref:Uncharacterized protein n=1 Tax=Hibiscus sabdariffa TaxID=183260 RepID=A0ABR2EEF2_9ROSI
MACKIDSSCWDHIGQRVPDKPTFNNRLSTGRAYRAALQMKILIFDKTKVLTLNGVDSHVWIPKVLRFRKNGQILLQVHNVKMDSLDLNTQQMEASLNVNCQQFNLDGVDSGLTFLSVDGYVKSLVFLNKAVDVCSYSDVNHPIDSSDSDESRGERMM